MIKIVTGFSGPGGSTVALANLCNLFNSTGNECEFYGPTDWVKKILKTDCYRELKTTRFFSNDKIIYHFLNLTMRPNVDKFILSCHETNVFELRKIPNLAYDKIHFVSNFQKNWQGFEGVVIPNIIPKYNRSVKKNYERVAGIIGSLDAHKRTHLSILRAKQDPTVSKIELWGQITQPDYFWHEVAPLLNENISYHGFTDNMQKVYDRLDVVYSSSQRECLPMIQGECLYLGLPFNGLPENMRTTDDYIFDDNVILNKWKELLS